MNENQNLVYSLLHKTVTENCFKNSLTFVEDSQLLVSNSETSVCEITSLINTKLHGSENDRFKAFQLLEKYLSQCPSHVFASNAIQWLQHCIKWTQRTTNFELTVLNKLINMSTNNPDLKKQISAAIIPRFIERLNSCKNTSKRVTILKLICLKSFLDGFASCSQFKNQFNKYILYVLKEFAEMKDVVLYASKCFVSLYCCGGKGHLGVNYKETWASQYKAVISTINKLLNDIYNNISNVNLGPEKDYTDVINDLLELNNENTSNPIMRYYRMKINFEVLSCIMKSMMLEKFPVNKTFQPEELLNLICRVLSVTCCMLNKADLNNDIVALNMNIPDIHCNAFDMLKAVILCAGKNLIVYGTLICKLCIQSLKWTSLEIESKNSQKPFRLLRKKAYETLCSWLSVAGASSSIEIFSDEIVPALMHDIEYRKRTVTLVQTDNSKKKKRKRSQFMMERSIPDSVTSLDKQANKIICIWAHKTLQLTLISASIFIKWEHHKNLQNIIVNQLLDILKIRSVTDYPPPYSHTHCRLMMYKSLLILVTEPHPKWSTPASYAINIFNSGVKDFHIEISDFCRRAINEIELLIHPKAPTLNKEIICEREERKNIDCEENSPKENECNELLIYPKAPTWNNGNICKREDQKKIDNEKNNSKETECNELLIHPKAPTLNKENICELEEQKNIDNEKNYPKENECNELLIHPKAPTLNKESICELEEQKNIDNEENNSKENECNELLIHPKAPTLNKENICELEEQKNIDNEKNNPKENECNLFKEQIISVKNSDEELPPKKRFKCSVDENSTLDPDVSAMLDDFVDIVD